MALFSYSVAADIVIYNFYLTYYNIEFHNKKLARKFSPASKQGLIIHQNPISKYSSESIFVYLEIISLTCIHPCVVKPSSRTGRPLFHSMHLMICPTC